MARLIAKTNDMEREEWLALRRMGIGGSDAAAVAGVSKWASPLTVYMEKRGLYKRPQTEQLAEAAYWGNTMEPVLRKEFKKRINAEREAQGLPPLWVQQRHALFAHDEHDFMRTNLDGQIMGHELGTGILEIKTSSEYLKDEWDGEDVPNAYFLQVQHNIKVMEAAYAYLVVLIGGNKYKHYFIERDDETIGALVAIEYDFWHNHVNAAIPPAMDGTDATTEMHKLMYPQSQAHDAPIVNLPNALIDQVETLDVVKELLDCLEEQKAKCENEIKAAMGTTETAWAGPHKITWKTASNGVRSMRITCNPDNNKKDEVRAKYQRAIDRKKAELEKEKAALEKERLKAEKEAEKAKQKARQDAEKAAKKAVKDAKKAIKDAEKNKSMDDAVNDFIEGLKGAAATIETILNEGAENV